MSISKVVFAILAVRVACSHADVVYTITPEIIDGGGLRGSSASYSVDFSAASGNHATSSNYTNRTGYAAQLNDAPNLGLVIGITIYSSRTSLGEGTSLQLCAQLDYDHGSSVLLPSSALTWTVQSGPLAAVTSNGLASADLIYQDSSAVVKAVYQSITTTITLKVLNTNNDNFGTYANDGIDDAWQVKYFGIGNPSAAPFVDPDFDGQDNLFEYNAGLVPTDGRSRLIMEFVDASDQFDLRRITMRPRYNDRVYTLESSTTLEALDWAPLTTATRTDNGLSLLFADAIATEQRKFYRIIVRKP